jgi:hypothetical protein
MTILKNMKAKAATVLAAGFLAGALVMAAPTKAEAQGFAVGVQFGGPRYHRGPVYAYGPRYAHPPVVYGPGYYGYRHDRWHRGYWR